MFVGANPSIRAVLTLTFYGESVLLLPTECDATHFK